MPGTYPRYSVAVLEAQPCLDSHTQATWVASCSPASIASAYSILERICITCNGLPPITYQQVWKLGNLPGKQTERQTDIGLQEVKQTNCFIPSMIRQMRMQKFELSLDGYPCENGAWYSVFVCSY